MMEAVCQSPLFGIALTLAAYEIGVLVAKRFSSPLANPMIIASVICIAVLKITGIPLSAYAVGGDILTVFMFPATTCIAVSVYAKSDLLKRYLIPVLAGCTAGAATSIGSVLLLGRLLGLSDQLIGSLVPKSVTTAIAIELSPLVGGVPSITVMAVVITGVTGVLAAPVLIRMLGIKDPVVQGVAIGASSHVIGTAKAIELGQTQGAMSGIAIFVTGIATVILSILFF